MNLVVIEEMKMIKVCAWCKKPMGLLSWSFRIFRLKKKISHGICWSCHKIQLERLQKFSGSAYHNRAHLQDQLKEVA
jgi:hypothetical protein